MKVVLEAKHPEDARISSTYGTLTLHSGSHFILVQAKNGRGEMVEIKVWKAELEQAVKLL